MKFFFVTTDHLEKKVWFRDEDDFKVGMNYVAVSVATTGVRVLAFILMSNHVHFLLNCEKAKAQRFIEYYKKLYGTHFRNKYGEKRFFRRNGVVIEEIQTGDSALETVIAYIVMNSVAARICAAANGYRFGSGSCYFNDNKETGCAIGSLSGRKRMTILKSKTPVPEKWIIGSGGYVLPESFIPVEFVEKLFKTPARYNYFLRMSSKARKAADKSGPSFRDQVMIESLKDLCYSLFGKPGISALDETEKAEAVKQLRWRFGADSHQISRISGISYPIVTEMLNRL